jgi:hypothetical protein
MDKITVGCYVQHDDCEYYDNSNGYNVLSVDEEEGTCWISNGVVTMNVEIESCTRISVARAVYCRITDEFASFEDSIAVDWLANLLAEHPEIEPTFHRYLQVNVKPEDLLKED